MAHGSDARTLVMWTESYPYTTALEHTFLEHELPALVRTFDRVFLVPGQHGGDREEVPDGITVDESYASRLAMLGRRRLLSLALRVPFLLRDPLTRSEARNAMGAKRLLVFAGQAEHARRWAIEFCRRERIATSHCVFYTYWWTAATTGFGLAKVDLPGCRVVTRAHGFDLYEERHVPAYIPSRVQSLQVLDALYPDSDRGREYLERTYPLKPPILETARLGVKDPGALCPPSRDGVLRVVSCSRMVAVKRIDHLIDGLAKAGSARPGQRIDWTHFGMGPLHDELERRVRSLPTNVTARFAGYSTQDELFAFYAAHPVDVFANVSVSEGTAVSIMEAIASGIPILATAVGGNTEIVTRENGRLVGPAADPSEIASALFEFVDRREDSASYRNGSRELWRKKYNADRNFADFATQLATGVPAARSAKAS